MEDNRHYTFSNTLLKVLREQCEKDEVMEIGETLDITIKKLRVASDWYAGAGLRTALKKMGAAILTTTDLHITQALEEQKPPITCREGCAHCCKQGVMIGQHEAFMMVEGASKRGIPIDRARLERQTHYETEEQWSARSEYNRRCVFLGDDNRCQVYPVRPMACRKYFSLGEPSACDIDKHNSGEVLTWFSLDAEIFSTAVMTQFGSDWMPRMLLAELTRREEEAHVAAEQHRHTQAL